MVSVDKAFELRYNKGNQEYQLLVDFDILQNFRKTPDSISVYDVLADSKIYKDQRKGEHASENLLKKSFGSMTEEEIIKEMLLHGECQIPTSYLNKLREEKKMQVVNYIAENAINPGTKGKYTPSMIASEIDKLKFNFKPDQDFVHQAEDVLKLLKTKMAITISSVILDISVPPKHVSHFYGPFRKNGKILKEYFDNEGNLRMHLEITSGRLDTVIDIIKKNSKGEASYHTMNK